MDWRKDMARLSKLGEELCEDLNLKVKFGVIKAGDLYIGERNTGPKLLTCRENKNGIIFPTTKDYPYDEYDCLLVVEK